MAKPTFQVLTKREPVYCITNLGDAVPQQEPATYELTVCGFERVSDDGTEDQPWLANQSREAQVGSLDVEYSKERRPAPNTVPDLYRP